MYNLAEYSFDSANGTGYVLFDHTFWAPQTLSLTIYDPNGSAVYNYHAWYNTPSPPVYGSFFAWMPGTYKAVIRSDCWQVNWQYGAWLSYNLQVLYPTQ